MQYVNNDMDNVFKRAAENYPLKTSGADWNKVSAALNTTTEIKKIDKKSYNKYLFILLFLGLPFLCNEFTKINFGAKSSGKMTVSQNNQSPSSSNSNDKDHNDNYSPDEPFNPLEVSKNISNNNTEPLNFNVLNLIQNKKLPVPDNDEETNDHKNLPLDNTVYQNFIDSAKTDEVVAIKTESVADTVEDNETAVATTTTLKKKTGSKKLYAGFVGGADITTIKFQQASNAGYDFGFLIGYKISDKWGVETGILSTKKNYYTDGKYYDAYNLYLSSNTKIISVDGNCQMIEIPIILKYNFSKSDIKTWFATAGFSNFFMKEENYDYMYLYISSGTQAKHTKSYKNSSNHLMSILQISGGYELNVKQLADVRIEPYLQVPLSGVGSGNLPLTSLGLRIGITRKLY